MNFFGNVGKSVDNFFEIHFIDMCFRMLFHILCIVKSSPFFVEKINFKKKRNYTYTLCPFFKNNTIYGENTRDTYINETVSIIY